jgi:hypothetical protein
MKSLQQNGRFAQANRTVRGETSHSIASSRSHLAAVRGPVSLNQPQYDSDLLLAPMFVAMIAPPCGYC